MKKNLFIYLSFVVCVGILTSAVRRTSRWIQTSRPLVRTTLTPTFTPLLAKPTATTYSKQAQPLVSSSLDSKETMSKDTLRSIQSLKNSQQESFEAPHIGLSEKFVEARPVIAERIKHLETQASTFVRHFLHRSTPSSIKYFSKVDNRLLNLWQSVNDLQDINFSSDKELSQSDIEPVKQGLKNLKIYIENARAHIAKDFLSKEKNASTPTLSKYLHNVESDASFNELQKKINEHTTNPALKREPRYRLILTELKLEVSAQRRKEIEKGNPSSHIFQKYEALDNQIDKAREEEEKQYQRDQSKIKGGMVASTLALISWIVYDTKEYLKSLSQ